QILSLGSLVYTLTDMSFIDGVIVTVEGVPVLSEQGQDPILLNRQNVRNNPTIDPEKTEWQTVTLYFCDRSGEKLVPEQRSVEIKKSLTLEYQIVEQLIVGPDKKMLKSTIPSDTDIRDIKTEDGICYVNLSRDFIKTTPEGISSELVKIYSIVDSLTELNYVNKVQFLIDGEKVNETGDGIDFSKPFDRKTDIIKTTR
ncbi:MAG: GerMN domain-containing protein, partial [Lachnospirales bacterium]